MSNDTKTYNGYKNYETWNIVLWLYNDEGNYDELRRRTRPFARSGADEGEVQRIVTDIFASSDGAATPDGVWLDDSRIDWEEIERVILEDFR